MSPKDNLKLGEMVLATLSRVEGNAVYYFLTKGMAKKRRTEAAACHTNFSVNKEMIKLKSNCEFS